MPEQINIKDIEIKKLELYTSFGLYDLKPHLMEISVFEDIFQPYLTSTVVLTDSHNISNKLPIVGQETLNMDISLKGFEGQRDEHVLSVKPPTFHVNSQSSRYNVNPKTQNFHLDLVSEKYMNTIHTKVSKSYKDIPISSMVLDIHKQYLSSSGQSLLVEDTVKGENIIIPSLNPIKAIQWLAKRAVSEESAVNYLFFEAINSSCFLSLSSLSKLDPVATLIHRVRVDDTTGVGHKAESIQKINKFYYKAQFKKHENVANGVYSSKLITHDIVRKKIEQSEYNLFTDWYKLNHCGDYFPISNSPLETNSANVPRVSYAPPRGSVSVDQKELANQVDSKVSFYPKHDSLYGDFRRSGYDNEVENWKLQRAGHVGNFNGVRLVLEIAGNTGLRVGQTVKVILPAPESTDIDKKSDSANDKYISGKYIITAIQHIFERTTQNDPRISYAMRIEVTKDGLEKEVPYKKLREV